MFCEESCWMTGNDTLWENVFQLPRVSLVCNEVIELLHHLSVVVLCLWIYRNHTRSITYAETFLTRQTPMNVASQCGEIGDVLYVLLVVQDALVQV